MEDLSNRSCQPVLLALALGSFVLSTQAQLLTTSAVDITMTTGTVVTVEGSVLLGTSTSVTNHGDLRIAGNWTNNSGSTVFSAGSTGAVELYSATTQSILGSSITDFRNLRLLNGVKQLQRNAVVGTPATPDGTLELGVGAVLLLENQTFSVFNPASTAVIDNGGWIASESLPSRFQWALGADVSAHRIPFGTPAGPSFPFAYTPTAPVPDGTLLSVATYRSAPSNLPYPSTAFQTVTHMAGTTAADNSDNTADRFWLVDLPNGTFTGTLLLSFTADEDPLAGPGNCRAQRWLESPGTWEFPPPPGQSNPAVREVLVPNVLFSETVARQNEHIWALSYDNAPLPIELLRFTATPTMEGEVRCDWTTITERDNAYFTVERSADAELFRPLGQVDGAGTSLVPLDYSFVDRGPLPGWSYYRLRQTDVDGTSTLSDVVPVHIAGIGTTVLVYPNPNNGIFTLHRDATGKSLPMELVDGSGRVVQQWTLPLGAEREQITVNGANGLYTVRWAGGQVRVNVMR
ncbi:MAG: T9SS type A sorting domain-containing protein [Flavobacteriales bacterium]